MVLRQLWGPERTVWGSVTREVTRLPTSASNLFIFEVELVAEHLQGWKNVENFKENWKSIEE